MVRPTKFPFFAAALLVGVTLAGCGSASPKADSGKLQVEAAFYPLAWITEQIGGENVQVSSLTRAGTEPHDLELTPKAVGQVTDADLVVYLSGFQPAVDSAIPNPKSPTVFDARDAAQLVAVGHESDHGEDGHDHSGTSDPHFWLDPVRLDAVAGDLSERLIELDPTHAAAFRTNRAQLHSALTTLDNEFDTGLADCASRSLVTSHEAFGYLAARYDLNQLGIVGINSEAEPSTAALVAVTDFVRKHDVATIYVEPLVSPTIAKTVANETGARIETLDPIESINNASKGTDYLSVMRSNLDALRRGQGCT